MVRSLDISLPIRMRFYIFAVLNFTAPIRNVKYQSEIDKWYENYIDELFAYGIAFGVEKDFVLDAIHDLFLHLFESADKIEILGSPKSYLFSALKNKIITSLRKQANWLS